MGDGVGRQLQFAFLAMLDVLRGVVDEVVIDEYVVAVLGELPQLP